MKKERYFYVPGTQIAARVTSTRPIDDQLLSAISAPNCPLPEWAIPDWKELTQHEWAMLEWEWEWAWGVWYQYPIPDSTDTPILSRPYSD